MAHVLLESIAKYFATVAVIDHLDLSIEDRQARVHQGGSRRW